MRESSTCKRQRQLEAEVEELHSAIKILNANNEDLKKTLADKESSLEDRTRANEDKRARLLRLSKEKSELANDNRILSLAVGNIKLKNEDLAEEKMQRVEEQAKASVAAASAAAAERVRKALAEKGEKIKPLSSAKAYTDWLVKHKDVFIH